MKGIDKVSFLEIGDLKHKWRGWDLNPRHKAYESSALPTELPRHLSSGKMVLCLIRFVNYFAFKISAKVFKAS